MSTAIAKAEQGGTITTSEHAAWTREQVDLVKRAICPKGISDDEFRVFIHQCQKTGMDPITKEAFCVPRRTNIGTKENPKWITNHVFEPSADGMRARAARFPDFLKVDSGAVFERDECEIDVDAGVVRHKFSPTKPRGRLIGAWGRVTKRDGTKVVAWLDVGDRGGTSSFWRNSQPRMMEKCSEVAAIRKAYPVHLGGVYAREEMDDAPQPSRAEVVLGTVAPVEVEAAKPHPPPALGPTVEFGEWKGREIEFLSTEEKQAAIRYAEEQVAQHPKLGAKTKAKLLENVEAIRASLGGLDVVGAEVVPAPEDNSALPLSHPDAEPPEDVVLPGGE